MCIKGGPSACNFLHNPAGMPYWHVAGLISSMIATLLEDIGSILISETDSSDVEDFLKKKIHAFAIILRSPIGGLN